MNNKKRTKEEEELYQIALADALEDAELKGFREGCTYISLNGDKYIAQHDPVPFPRYKERDRFDDVFLHCGEGQGLILNNKEWGRVIKK
jgi:hypothetical protein